MHELMQGMFWGGLVMAVPPVALGVWLMVLLARRQRHAGPRRPEEPR